MSISKSLILDVGSGINPKGNINVDRFIKQYGKRKQDLKNLNIPNLINADIHYLPFKDKSFDYCFCYHVLEHKEVKFISALKELLRVTKLIVEIEIPHRFFYRGKIKTHNKLFSCSTLKTLLRNMNLGFTFDILWRCYPFNVLCLWRIPQSMRIRIIGEI